MQPVQSDERLNFVDILRGFAVFGILVANMASYSGQTVGLWNATDVFDRWVLALIQLLVTAKFYTLFSFLFGWGMAIQMSRASSRGTRFVPLFRRRMLVLLLFGIIHGVLIWHGDILTVYALLGLLLLLFRNRSPRFLLVAAILCLSFSVMLAVPIKPVQEFRSLYMNATEFMRISGPGSDVFRAGSYGEITRERLSQYLSATSHLLFYFGNVFSMFLLGLYFGKRNLFRHVDRHLRLYRRLLAVGLPLGFGLNAIVLYSRLNEHWIPDKYQGLVQSGALTIGAPLLTLSYVSLFVLLLQRPAWQERLAPLGNVGRMALTNYLSQSVVGTLIFYTYGLGLFGRIGPATGFLFTVLIYLLQVRLSAWWFERYRFGPIEWVWRTLTYGKPPTTPYRPIGTSWGDAQPRPRALILLNRHPLASLGVVWLILIVWGGGLTLWYTRLSAGVGRKPIMISVQATAIPKSAETTSTGNSQPEQEIVEEAPPATNPVAYHPSPAVAAGDVLALAKSFDGERALDSIRTLTGPPYYGRYAGSAGDQAAGDFLAQEFARYRLQPAGDHGSFFQSFPIEYENLAETPVVQYETSPGGAIEEAIPYRDFWPLLGSYMGSGEGQGQVAWVDDCQADDFEALDVIGKVALCGRKADLKMASRLALEHSAAGLLIYSDSDTAHPDFASVYRQAWVPRPLPAARVYPSFVEKLLSGDSIRLEDLEQADQHFLLPSRVHLKMRVTGAAGCGPLGCYGRNVLGVLPGRDPEFADQVVILGAHYDHMGQAPEGTEWPGANDDASGVAVLLEIARTWQEQGYVPRRTVVFAAWDAEEYGLLGSKYYVQHPRYPLTITQAMLQLDMVGHGNETLMLGGEENLVRTLASLAEGQGVNYELSASGGSDQQPFLQASVPAALLIWDWDPGPDDTYHRPLDTVQTIEPEKLAKTGVIAGTAALNIVESEPAIIDLLAERAEAAVDGDLDRFLATSQPVQWSQDNFWFDDLQQFQPTSVEMKPIDLQFSGDEASAQVVITAEYPGESAEDQPKEVRGRLAVRFERGDTGWKWAGPDLRQALPGSNQVEEEARFQVAYPPEIEEDDLPGLGLLAAERYARISSLLGLSGAPDTNLWLFPSKEEFRTGIALSLPESADSWVTREAISLVYSPEVSASLTLKDAVVQLALAQAGVNEKAAPWLWQGLPIAFRSLEDRTVTYSRYLPDLVVDLGDAQVALDSAQAWGATQYLIDRLGWEGLGRFILRLGSYCQEAGPDCSSGSPLDRALADALGVDRAGFEILWREQWSSQISQIQAGLDQTLEKRRRAFLSGDRESFLQTVDPQVPNLVAEQSFWFSELESGQVENLELSAEPNVFYENGSILATVATKVQTPNNAELSQHSLALQVLFTPAAGGYLWSGIPLETLHGSYIDVRYPQGQEDLARALTETADSFYLELATVLDVEPAGRMTVALYPGAEAFRGSLSPSFPGDPCMSGWTAPGQSIKLVLNAKAKPQEYGPILAEQLARSMLNSLQVPDEWLLKGLSIYLTRSLDGGATQKAVATGLPQVSTALRQGASLDLTGIAGKYFLSKEDCRLARAQAWDSARFLIESAGWPAVLDLIHFSENGQPWDTAWQRAVGFPFSVFQQRWSESFLQARLSSDQVGVAQDFDQQQANEHIAYLTGSGMGGRATGTPGAQAAANYIARQFAQAGLTPVGDLDTGSYFQTFPVTVALQSHAPRLELVDENGDPKQAFRDRQDFLPLFAPRSEAPLVSGQLVWIGAGSYFSDDVRGKIVLQKASETLEEDIQQLAGSGALAVLIAGHRSKEEDIYSKQPLLPEDIYLADIPVLELTYRGSSQLLEAVGENYKSINELPAVKPFDAYVRLEYHPPSFQEVDGFNVLGLLPGSDPLLGQEVLLVGAHYDHVGDDPDAEVCYKEVAGQKQVCDRLPGITYSGANDDGSGVGVLLEIARNWRQNGYHPRRSVLFAAWGAQEYGQTGSKYFQEHPTVAVNSLLGMVQLDSVGGGEGFNLGAQADEQQDEILLFPISAAGSLLDEKVVYAPQVEPSDHFTFREQGLPTVLFAWRLASEANLPDNLTNAVSPEKLGVTGRLVSLALMGIAQ